MGENGLSLSDIAAATGNGFGGSNEFVWIFALLILFGGSGFGWNRNNTDQAIANNEILSGQKFDSLSRQINQVGDGLCSSTYALNNSILGEGRALQTQLANCCCENQRNTDSLRYDVSQMIANTNATTVNQTQKILDALAQNKIEELQAKVSQLETQNMFCGIPRISNYAYGVYPYATGCGMNNI